jgi:hypothetical protein
LASIAENLPSRSGEHQLSLPWPKATHPSSPRTPAAASGAGLGGAQPPSNQFLPPTENVEEPLKTCKMTEEINSKYSLFGYDIYLKEYDRIIGLRDDYKSVLLIGMQVVLLGDTRGYIPGGFRPGEEVTIIEFCEPFFE